MFLFHSFPFLRLIDFTTFKECVFSFDFGVFHDFSHFLKFCTNLCSINLSVYKMRCNYTYAWCQLQLHFHQFVELYTFFYNFKTVPGQNFLRIFVKIISIQEYFFYENVRKLIFKRTQHLFFNLRPPESNKVRISNSLPFAKVCEISERTWVITRKRVL